MSFLEKLSANSSYNYYPRTCIDLCVISYSEIGKISAEVSSQTDTQVVWGPYEKTDVLGIAYSLMYVAKRVSTNEYFVVIRGTNPISLKSWIGEDFDVKTAQPFGSLPGGPPGVPSDAMISQGTFNGMKDLISLNQGHGDNIVDFLRGIKGYVYVTGHSLGGTLTPPMFAYLTLMLNANYTGPSMALWSFAGLSAGGTGFNNFFNKKILINEQFLWRIHNTLDIAPFLWGSETSVENVYKPYGLNWQFPEDDLIKDLFDASRKAKIGYAQPQKGQPLTGTFETGIVDSHLWAAQAAHQHHATTYKPMVYKQFPS